MKSPKSSKKVPFDMSVKSKQSFPTVGEIVLFVLNGTGLWDVTDEKKKALQKKLQRFAKEEIILPREEINDIFEELLSSFLSDKYLTSIFADIIVGLIYGYPLLLKENASHLNKKETGLWILRVSIPAPLTVYLFQSMKLAEHPSVKKLFFKESPEIDLFLPDITENSSTYACSKVLRWWFDKVLKTSPEILIYKEKSKEPLSGGMNPEPRTVRNWFNGKDIPKIETLLDLAEHFEVDEKIQVRKQTFLVYMIIARLFDSFFRELTSNYDNEEINDISKEFLIIYKAFEENLAPILNKAFSTINDVPWDIWRKLVNETYEELLSKIYSMGDNIEASRNNELKIFYEIFAERYDANMKKTPFPQDKMNFAEKSRLLLNEGCNVKKNPKDIESFEEKVRLVEKENPHDGTLGFYTPVIRGRLEVFKNNFPRALSFYKEAFDKGRYSAGKFRERIVKELMGLCAYQYTILYDSKEQRGECEYYKVLKYLKDWCRLHYLHLDFVLEEDKYIELFRRDFEKTFRYYLPDMESMPVSIGEWDSVAGPETNEKMKNWKPNFRHPSRLVKDFETRDNSQLMVAIYLHRKDDALKLIEKGANLNYFNTTNDNAFNYAICNNLYDIALRILEGNINKEVLETPTKKHGNTGLGLAIKHRKKDLVKKILEIGVDPNKRLPGLDGEMTPLYLAIISYGEPTLEILCRKNIYGSDEESLEIIKILLEAGSLPNLPNINQLLEHKADPDHRINSGATALMFAVEKDFTEIAELLLKNGADPTITRDDGAMPLDFCKSEKMHALIIEGIRNYKPEKGIIINLAKA
ncbi:MAG TPA: ankyrin repeat domain-containing protein [bacterium]|nr:ankyrin repeat domain-containing protein [bacterium]